MDNYLELMIRELVKLFDEDGEVGKVSVVEDTAAAAPDSAGKVVPSTNKGEATTTPKMDKDKASASAKADKQKLITVEYTYTDKTSDAKVTFPTEIDTHTAAEVSFALAYALADVTLSGVGQTMDKGEKEELANKILQVIARELIKSTLLGLVQGGL